MWDSISELPVTEATDKDQRGKNGTRAAAAVLFLSAGIFVLDLLVPLGIADGMLYVAVVWFAASFPKTSRIWLVAAVCTVLTVLGIFFSPQGIPLEHTLINRIVSLFAVWALAWALVHKRRSEDAAQRNRQRLEQWHEAALEGILFYEGNRITEANQSLAGMFDCTAAELRGKSPLDLVSPDAREAVSKILLSGMNEPFDTRGQKKSGAEFPMELIPLPTTLPGLRGLVVRDATERQKAAERFGQLARWTDAVIWEANAVTLQVTFVSEKAVDMLGYPVSKWLDEEHFLLKVIHPDERPNILPLFQSAASSGKDFDLEFRALAEDGRTLWLRNIVTVLRDSEGRPAQLRGVMVDISERKRSEASLRESEHRHRMLLENFINGVVLVQEGKIAFANPMVCSLSGYSENELHGHDLADFVIEDDREPLHERMQAILAGGMEYSSVFHLARKDGTTLSVEVGFRAIQYSGRPALLSVVQDVSARIAAEKALQASVQKTEAALARFQGLLEAAPEAITIADRGGRIVLVNAATEKAFGYTREELLGQSIDMLVPERFRKDYSGSRAAYNANPYPRPMDMGQNLTALRKDGTEFPVEISLSPLETEDGLWVTSIIRDITDRQHLEEQLRQSQKMEALGRLASGVAHDFNNLLMIISGHTELTLHGLRPEDPLHGNVKEISRASERAAELTRQLLLFSRKEQFLQPKVLNLNDVVADVEKMLRRLIGEDIELLTRLGADLNLLKVDAGQIEQALINLAVNARDAMPRGGQLILETANIEFPQPQPYRHGTMPAGSYVMLVVTDTGHGMDMETQSHIFEPFFTTKQPGGGTGLGLAQVYGIVKQSGGFIWVYSEQDMGTTFKAYFPAVQDAAAVDAEIQGISEASLRGSGTVLVVEDELALGELAREFLEGLGYTVLQANNGTDALRTSEQYREPIHVMVTDVVMPGLSGPEVATRLLEAHPETKVLYMSGYTDNAVVLQGVLDKNSPFLQKPFSLDTLAEKVHDLLESNRAGN